MTSDEARECFSEALEDELDPERKKGFEEALANDEELRGQYSSFVETFRSLGRLDDGDDPPDLLRGVQERLRRRSKGRFYGDRFAQRSGAGWALPLIIGLAMLLTLVIAWVLLQSTVILEAPEMNRTHQSSGQ